MRLDLVIRNARTPEHPNPVDIGVRAGRVVAIEPALACDAVEATDAGGRLAFGGFVETHIHLDKACILGRCTICAGTLAEAVAETARAKAGYTEDDVYARAAGIVEKAITQGTNRLRTFVEIDPRAGLRSFEAIKRIRNDFAFAVDIEICAFAQDGLTNEMATFDMLDTALASGADLIGGCPYTDPHPTEHIGLVFDLAEKHRVPVDFHLDFDLDPAKTNLPCVAEETLRRSYQGKVSIGHMTSLSMLAPEALDSIAERLRIAGIALTVLPATDLFLMGRSHDKAVPRGVAPAHRLARSGVRASISTNNVMNPFTPFGDASLGRMANLYANIAQLARDAEIDQVFAMVTRDAARILGKQHGLRVGAAADIVLLDATDHRAAIREIAPPLRGWKNGRQTFSRPPAMIYRNAAQQP